MYASPSFEDTVDLLNRLTGSAAEQGDWAREKGVCSRLYAELRQGLKGRSAAEEPARQRMEVAHGEILTRLTREGQRTSLGIL